MIGTGLALTGLAMIAVLGTRMFEQPWLLVSLLTYAITAVVAFAVQRPSLRRLAPPRRHRDRGRPRGLAGPRPAPAVRRLRHHDGRRPHRLPHVDEARPVVTAREPQAIERPSTAAIVNLGCKVNQSEMEAAARLLRQAGVPLVDPSARADLYLVNTCTVTSTADEKSRAAVRRARRANPDARVVVTGCSVQVDPGAFAAVDPRRPPGRQRRQARVPRRARGADRRRRRPPARSPPRCRRCRGSMRSRPRRSTGSPTTAPRSSGPAPSSRCRTAARSSAPTASSRGPAAPSGRCPGAGPRRRSPRPRRRPPRDRPDRDQHRHLRRRLVRARPPRRAHRPAR